MRGLHCRLEQNLPPREKLPASASVKKERGRGETDVHAMVRSRREFFEELLGYSMIPGIAAGVLTSIGVSEYRRRKAERELLERRERQRLAKILQTFIAQFSKGELLELEGEKAYVQSVRSSGLSERVMICLNNLPVHVLPQLAQVLEERGVLLENVLLSEENRDVAPIHRDNHLIFLEDLYTAMNRLRRENDVEFVPEYGNEGFRRNLLQVLSHYTSVSSKEPDYAERVVVLLRDKEKEPEVNHRHLMDDLSQSPMEGGPDYAVIEIGDEPLDAIPPSQKEPIVEIVAAE